MWTLRSSNRKTTGESTKRPAVFTYRRASVSKKGYHFAKQFRKISALRLSFLFALTREEEIGTRSGRAGPPFSVRPEKEAKGAVFARHCGSGKLIVTNQPVRQDAQKLAASRRSNNSGARFLHCNAKNPLTSHAVDGVLCCLGLPSAVPLMKAGRENCVVVKLTGCAATFCVQK